MVFQVRENEILKFCMKGKRQNQGSRERLRRGKKAFTHQIIYVLIIFHVFFSICQCLSHGSLVRQEFSQAKALFKTFKLVDSYHYKNPIL